MDGRHIVLTGVSRGLGLALLREFVNRGHHVSGCARSHDRLQAIQREVGNAAALTTVDLRSEPDTRAWSASVLRQWGPPDLLICNAATINSNQPLWEVTDADFAAVMDVNVRATASLIRHFVPAMLPARSGVIATLSSGWGRSVAAEVAPYCASKWAIEGLTLSLAAELPRGMCAAPVNPGIINTEMLQSCFGSHASSWPQPEEWAVRAAPFFLELGSSDNGRSLTVPD